jgi:hypothetical protein
MRISQLTTFIFLIFLGILIFSCNKKVDVVDTDYQKERLTELIIPLEKGKYITYRVDSTIFTNFGRNTEIHSYLIKHVVDTAITIILADRVTAFSLTCQIPQVHSHGSQRAVIPLLFLMIMWK